MWVVVKPIKAYNTGTHHESRYEADGIPMCHRALVGSLNSEDGPMKYTSKIQGWKCPICTPAIIQKVCVCEGGWGGRPGKKELEWYKNVKI